MPYLGKQSEQGGVSIQKYEYLQGTDSSSGATSFAVPSDSGDHVNVWLNGVLLVEGGSNDYTTTTAAVVFASAPADGDQIRIDVIESFAFPDAIKSSGGTMSGALKLDGGLKQQTSANLNGTYDVHQILMSDAFTLTGDVTISDNLILSKISDDGNAITITDDGSTRTIVGSGSLETSTIAQTPNASLTGMTGTVGSGVTFASGVSSNWGGCKVYRSSNQTISNASTTQVEFDTEVYDTLNEYANNKYTALHAGIYLINTNLKYVDMGDQKYLMAYVKVNGTTVAIFDHKSSSGSYESVACTTIHKLVVSDYIQIDTRHDHGSNRDLASGLESTNFCVQRIG